MEPVWIGFIGVVTLLVFIAAGVRIAVVLTLIGAIGLAFLIGVTPALSVLVETTFYRVYRVEFVIIPLFILVGLIAALGGLSRDTYQALSLWLNRVRGGLGIATVAGCTAFGTVSGSSLVTATVFAKVSAPDMRRQGYSKQFAYGICSSAGMIGMLIPPSVFIIIYSILTEESPGKLLIAGITPGLLCFVIYSIGISIIGYLNPAAVGRISAVARVSWRQRIASLRLMWPMALVATILIMGVFFGFFAVVEAASFAVGVVIIVVLVRVRSLKGITEALSETASITAMVFFILIGGTMFARFLVFSGVTAWMMELIIVMDLSPLGMVIVTAILYLILGCFLDGISAMCITLPVLYPTIMAAGIEPIWFAMVVILSIEIGVITPPVGINVYAVKGVAEPDVSIEDLFRGVIPFFFMNLVVLVIIIAFPVLSQILPALMMD